MPRIRFLKSLVRGTKDCRVDLGATLAPASPTNDTGTLLANAVSFRLHRRLFFPMKKPNVLILCTGNSCRSHMAEGIFRELAGDLFEVHSAGSRPAGYVHPKAIAVMAEVGVDILAHTSKHVNDFLDKDISVVITVCGNADQACPTFPGKVIRYHWGFDDPAHATGNDSEVLDVFRRVRDEITGVFGAYAAGYRQALNTDQAKVF